jgi:hypothetical protein
MPSQQVHDAIHGQFGQARYSPLQRYIEGTPGWWKRLNASAAMHPIGETKRLIDDHSINSDDQQY